jgi:hypothetical protein
MKQYKTVKKVMGAVLGMSAVFMVLTMAGCGSSGSSGGGSGGPFNSEQLSALAQMFASTANTTLTMGTSSYAPVKINGLHPLSSCGPSTLIPPTNCPGGGNIYYTLNMNCTMPSGCCSNNSPCPQDSMSINGQGSINYNSCAETITTTGDHLMINGTITMGLTSKATIQCGGAVDVDVTVTFTGMPTISVNGKDVCHGDIFITAKGHAGASNYTSVSGTICGQHLYEYYNYGCSVTCADKSCCYAGTYCSTCYANACIPDGGVDCCNGNYCPAPYKTCNTSANTCSLSFNGLDFIPAMPSFEAVK